MTSAVPLRRFLIALAATALLAGNASAQISWETTQSTNGTRDVGSAGLASGKLRVKVFPAYLDVEEEVDLVPTGTVRPQNDASSLLVTGRFILPAGAVITGALLWEGNRILQARLLDRPKADSLYEHLADGDSVLPLRLADPLILERTAANAYTLRIRGAVLGASRRFRLRYQLPPRLGTEGFEMRLTGALLPLFPNTSVPAALEGQAGVPAIRLFEGTATREATLPRTVFLNSSALAANAAPANAARILPLNPRRQVQVKTSFGAGGFQGHYLNFYGEVDEGTLAALGRIEVVMFWKWHNPIYWQNAVGFINEAKSQATTLLALHDALGAPGTRVGLLHDNSLTQRAFPAAAQGETSYANARAYLQSLQNNTINNFVDSLGKAGGSSGPPAVQQSRSRFLANMQIVKTLYSPEEGVTRHLILVSAGAEYATEDLTANAKFDSMFADRPVSVGPLGARAFSQAGLNYAKLRQDHPITGSTAPVAGTSIPGFPNVTFFATLRNSAKAYDFSVACAGGITVTCPTLEFHGKAATPWSDTVEWEAYKTGGPFLGRSKTRPFVISADADTATALLWAGSSAPFSEMKEPALGPAYGFVDASATLLARAQDSLSPSQGQAYADTGVARGGPLVIPERLPGDGPMSVRGTASDATAWRIERSGANALSIRVPGLAAGARVEIELIGLDGKRVAFWIVTAEAGLLRWNVSGLRPGAYLLRMRGPNLRGERLLTL